MIALQRKSVSTHLSLAAMRGMNFAGGAKMMLREWQFLSWESFAENADLAGRSAEFASPSGPLSVK
jgi:hypothetical protein